MVVEDLCKQNRSTEVYSASILPDIPYESRGGKKKRREKNSEKKKKEEKGTCHDRQIEIM
jgi:hypothetical protein